MVSIASHLRLLLLVFKKDRLHIGLLAGVRRVLDSDVARVRTQKSVRLLALFDFFVLDKQGEIRSEKNHTKGSLKTATVRSA